MKLCKNCGAPIGNAMFNCCDQKPSGLEAAFRKLRDAWFWNHLASQPHERDWEYAEQEQRGQDENERRKNIYDQQTELMIAGHSTVEHQIAPKCMDDAR